MVNIIWLVLVLFALLYIYVFAVDIIKNRNNLENVSWLKTGLIGFVVNFLTYWVLVRLHHKQHF